MNDPKLSRRRFLALSGALVASGLLDWVPAQGAPKQPVRIGAVLPTQTGQQTLGPFTEDLAGEAARLGAIMGEEEVGKNADLLGKELRVLIAAAPGAEAAVRAAERLAAEEEVFAIFGGFSEEEAKALGEVARKRKLLYFNVGASSDRLRGEDCNPYTFHVEASAAMYLDALVDWYVRAGFRRWFFVTADDEQGEAHYQRAHHALEVRHFGGGEVGRAKVAPDQPSFTDVFETMARAKPDVVLLLTDAPTQLVFLGEYDASGLQAEVTGFPWQVAQTRAFYAASAETAPKAGSGNRAALWEATLDAYGARELNARFLARWGKPMDPAAWAAYVAVKLLFETAVFANTQDADKLVSYLQAPTTVFDVYKGIGTTFRPWDNQLRESLFLSKINAEAKTAWDRATLVGELPAIYKPGTDPIERLDQIGILQAASQCSF